MMLKKMMVGALALAMLSSAAFSQNAKNDLTGKALTLYQQGKYEKAIEAAEQVVKLEKAEQSENTFSYANALVNAGRMNYGYLLALETKLGDRNAGGVEKLALYKETARIAADAENYLRQAIALNEAGDRAQTAQTADVKSELAMLVQKYNPAAKPSVGAARARIDDAEKLLTESLAAGEQVRGRDDARTLAVVLQFGDFYLRYVNFEKALPFYERYIAAAETKGAKNYPDLPAVLRAYAGILSAGFMEREAADALAKIETITQKKEPAKFADFNFQLRSKDAVEYASRNIRTFKTDRLVTVKVKVIVDENGKVIETFADEKDTKLRARAERETSKWLVRPFVYQGISHKLRGILTYWEIR